MVNHVRTLLRNTDAEPYAGKDGQEIIDPAYRRVDLPAALARVHAALFGRRPDRTALDLKLRRYMAVLHATGLEDYVYAADPRVTYPAPAAALEFDFTPAVAPAGGHGAALYLSGDPPAEDGGGALEYAWLVTALAAAPGPAARAELLRPNMRTVTTPVAYDAGLGSPFALPGAGLLGRFHAGLPDGTGWVVTCTARPAADLGAVVAGLDAAGEDVPRALFGAARDEPYRTWGALWGSAAPLPYRLGAALLALASRTDELRKGR